MIMGQGARMIFAGLVLGMTGALALGRALAARIPEVGAADPIVLAGAALALTGAALVASWLPARRAARVDPMEALRRDQGWRQACDTKRRAWLVLQLERQRLAG
jgi:putative ABC transport system permease protein